MAGRKSTPLALPDLVQKLSTDDGPMLRAYMRETNGGGSLEQVAGYPTRRAITDGFPTARLPTPPSYMAGIPPAALLPPAYLGSEPLVAGSILPVRVQAPEFAANFETVHGVDNRVLIPDTATIPWRCICHLQVVFDDGEVGYGTGWLAGPRTVITAGHCVVDARAKRRAAEIFVTPGRNGPIGPYGQFASKVYAVFPGWPDSKRPEHDLAAIALPEEQSYSGGPGRRLGFFGAAAFTNKKLHLLLVNTAGYPLEARKPFGTQWFNAGRIKDVKDTYLTYMIDTEGGQSGSPVFFYDESSDQRLVVAIHTTGYYPNRGLRITAEVLDAIHNWAETPPEVMTSPRPGRESRHS